MQDKRNVKTRCNNTEIQISCFTGIQKEITLKILYKNIKLHKLKILRIQSYYILFNLEYDLIYLSLSQIVYI